MTKRLSEKTVFKNKVFHVKDIEVNLNDKTHTFSILEKGDTALLVPITENNEVIFIKEYFAAINEYQVALPKGRIENNLNALETANKELQEEIGFKANKLDKIAVLTMSPGYFTQKTNVFVARDLIESKLDGDEDSIIEIFKYPLSHFEDLINKGELTESRMISTLFLARSFLKR
jgi:ADP-ribose diphosphatase